MATSDQGRDPANGDATGWPDLGPHGRHVVWQSLDSPGLEHVRVRSEGDQLVAQGRTVRVPGGLLEDLRWRIECDPDWRTRSLRVLQHQRLHPLLAVERDAAGRWGVVAGSTEGRLAGCIDVDLAVTPFTNTLPIRRLAPWRTGEEVTLRVALADPEAGTFRPVRQSYTLLSVRGSLRVFRYRNLDSGFEAELGVDPDGFVVDYEGLFRRTWSA